MGSGESEGAPQTGEKHRMVCSFFVEGDLRFISHHDMQRLFKRALARSGLPVRFTEGFNPHPRMSLPLPRPVGISSNAELLVVELTEAFDSQEAMMRLGEQLPKGMGLDEVRAADKGERFQPDEVRYQIEIEPDRPDDLQQRIRHLLSSDVANIQRVRPKTGKSRSIDVRPYLASMTAGDTHIEFVLRVTQTGTAKPSEIAGLLGYDSGSVNHRIRRMEVRWQ